MLENLAISRCLFLSPLPSPFHGRRQLVSGLSPRVFFLCPRRPATFQMSALPKHASSPPLPVTTGLAPSQLLLKCLLRGPSTSFLALFRSPSSMSGLRDHLKRQIRLTAFPPTETPAGAHLLLQLDIELWSFMFQMLQPRFLYRLSGNNSEHWEK